MDLSRGYLLIARSLDESDIFQNEKWLKVYIWCLIQANHKGKNVPVKSGRSVYSVWVDRGQFVYGRFKAGDKLGMPPSTVRNILERLADEPYNNLKLEPKDHYTIVTVVDYDFYQDSENYKNQLEPEENGKKVVKNVKKVEKMENTPHAQQGITGHENKKGQQTRTAKKDSKEPTPSKGSQKTEDSKKGQQTRTSKGHNQYTKINTYSKDFEDVWGLTPKRNGTRQGKKAASDLYVKLSGDDRQKLKVGLINYAKYLKNNSFQNAMDLERFIRKRFFDDYQEPIEVQETKTPGTLTAIPGAINV
jgi:hypothetical protein